MSNEHDLEHETGHEHDADCTCGCHEGHEHTYEHHHDGYDRHHHEHAHGHHHEHGHGHDHEHHHHSHMETLQLENALVELEAHTHEQAATVSMRIHPADGATIAFADIIAALQRIARAAEDVGGIVGHIKGFAKQGDAFAHASVTAADLDPTTEGDPALTFGASADIQLAAIVLLVSQNDLLALCKEALAAH